MISLKYFFFFSSRRRHTRLTCDWSSDVALPIFHAAVKGAKVALVERDRVGGICVTVGCIPSKALLDSSHAYWLATHGEEHGIHVAGARFELPAAVARKDRVVAQLVSGVEALLKGRKADLIKGEGTLVSPTQVRVG